MFLLHDAIPIHAEERPERPALVEGERTLTFAALEARTRRGAGALVADGVAPGDRVVVPMAGTIDAVVAAWSVLRAGAVLVPVPGDGRPARIERIVADCAAVRVLPPERLAAAIDAAVGPAAGLPSRIDHDLACIIYTSGTSGEPKGVMLTHRNLANTTAAIAAYLGQTSDDVTCCLLPLAFSYGLFQVFTSLRVGAAVVLERSFAYPFDVLRRIERHRATILPAVPTIFAKLLGMAPIEGVDLGSLRILTNAAAALPPSHVLRLCEAFPRAAIIPMYGQTECTRACFLDPKLTRSHPDSVGRAIPNSEAYLVDDAGRRLPPGSEGELVVRGANVMRGYWGRDAASAERLPHCLPCGSLTDRATGERVLRTGDRFRTDRDGLLRFVARTDDIFKCRGEKVAPGAIEHVLCELPDVVEAAVIGVEDATDGMAIRAVIVPREGSDLTEQRVRQHCRATLDPAFMPKFIEFRGSLPKTESGKLRRLDLHAADAANAGGGRG